MIKGSHHSEKTKKEMSKKRKGKPSWNKGILCFPETKEKIRKTKKGKNTGFNNHFYGKHHSPESKQKIRNGKKGQIPWNKGIKTGILTLLARL